MKETEKLAPLSPALSWNSGQSCSYRNVTYSTDMGPNLEIKIIAIYSKNRCVVTSQ